MTIETQDDVVALKRIGRIDSRVLQRMLDAAEPGMTTRDLDLLGEQYEHTMIITKNAPIIVTQH